MFEVRVRKSRCCEIKIFFFICVWITLGTLSFKLRKYSKVFGFVELADCKTAASYSFNKTVIKIIRPVFPFDQEFLLSLLIFSKEQWIDILHVVSFWINFIQKMLLPNATVPLAAHSTAILMPCDFSSRIVCRSVSVILLFKRIYNFVHLWCKSSLFQI